MSPTQTWGEIGEIVGQPRGPTYSLDPRSAWRNRFFPQVRAVMRPHSRRNGGSGTCFAHL